MMTKLSENEKIALEKLKHTIQVKYQLLEFKLFGSKSRGEFSAESDIDIFIVLDKVDWEIEKDIYEMCFEIGLEHDLLFCPVVFSQAETEDRFTKITPFYQTVVREGIPL